MCPVDITRINECGTVVCTYLEFHFLVRLLYFLAGVRTFIIISVSFVCRARCHNCLVSNSKKFRVHVDKTVLFVDFDTRRRLMDSSTIRAPVLNPLQVPVHRAYINPHCGQDEIMKTKLFCLRVGNRSLPVRYLFALLIDTILPVLQQRIVFRLSGLAEG
jgi:hypothetical protein